MNKHILLVMKYLDDNNSVTAQELLDNHKAAAIAYATAADTDFYTAYIYALAADAASAADADADVNYAKNTIDWYFGYSKENKQDYINEIAKNKGDKQ